MNEHTAPQARSSRFVAFATMTIPVFMLASAGCDRNESKAASADVASMMGTARAASPAAPDAGGAAPTSTRVEIPEIIVRADGPTTVHVAWSPPPGTAVNDDAPFRVRWSRSEGLAEAPADMKATGSSVRDGFRVNVVPSNATAATLVGDVDLVVCDVETHAVCLPVHRTVELDFFPEKVAMAEVRVAVPLPAAKSR